MKEKERAGQPPKVEATPKFLFGEEWLDNAPSEKPTNNLTTEEWEALRPELGRNEFIRQLHERVSALEADTTQLRKEIKNLRANMLKFMGITWSANLLTPDKSDMFQSMLNTYVGGIREFVQNNEIDKANWMLLYTIEDATEVAKQVGLRNGVAKQLINRFTQIEGCSQLEKADEFIALVSSIAEMPQSSGKGGVR